MGQTGEEGTPMGLQSELNRMQEHKEEHNVQ